MNIAVIFFIFFVWIAIVVGICALFVWICKKLQNLKGYQVHICGLDFWA